MRCWMMSQPASPNNNAVPINTIRMALLIDSGTLFPEGGWEVGTDSRHFNHNCGRVHRALNAHGTAVLVLVVTLGRFRHYN